MRVQLPSTTAPSVCRALVGKLLVGNVLTWLSFVVPSLIVPGPQDRPSADTAAALAAGLLPCLTQQVTRMGTGSGGGARPPATQLLTFHGQGRCSLGRWGRWGSCCRQWDGGCGER